MPEIFQNLIIQARRTLKPLSYIPLSQWASKRKLSGKETSMPGQINPNLFPFWNFILDAANDKETEEISVMSSAQIGKTELIKSIINYYIEYDPQNILLVEPTQTLARMFSANKLDPMIEANEELRSKISKKKSRDSENTLVHKAYYGGSLDIVGSNSPNDLSANSKKIVLSDDIDRMPESAGNEGDPVYLAEQRTESYRKIGGFKHIRFSTPTIKNKSRIERYYNNSNQCMWYIPCPFCMHLQVFNFDNLYWEKETGMFGEKTLYHADISKGNEIDLKEFGKRNEHHPETVKYKCSNDACGTLIEHKHQYWMNLNGKPIAKYPERKKHIGLWIHRLYSPLATWSNMVKDYLEAFNDPKLWQPFLNTALALTYDEQFAQEIKSEGFTDKLENYFTDEYPFLPKEILLITGGVDVHPDRLILQLLGWAFGKIPYVIYYEQIYGDVYQDDVWQDLDDRLTMKFNREDGLELSIGIHNKLTLKNEEKEKIIERINYLTFVDAGDSTSAVYSQCLKRQKKGIIAIKGRSAPGKHILINTTKVGPKGKQKATILKNINVDAIKDRLFKLLQQSKDNPLNSNIQRVHFTKRFCDEEYFEGLVSEKPIRVYDKKLGMKIQWTKKSKSIRNEPLDTFNYAWAAMESLVPNFEAIKDNQQKRIKKMIEEGKILLKQKPIPEIFEQQKEKIKPQEIKQPVKPKIIIKPVRKNWVTQY